MELIDSNFSHYEIEYTNLAKKLEKHLHAKENVIVIHVLEGAGASIENGEKVMYINQPNIKKKNVFIKSNKSSDFEITYKCLKFEERIKHLANFYNSYHIAISTGCNEVKENLKGLFLPSYGN